MSLLLIKVNTILVSPLNPEEYLEIINSSNRRPEGQNESPRGGAGVVLPFRVEQIGRNTERARRLHEANRTPAGGLGGLIPDYENDGYRPNDGNSGILEGVEEGDIVYINPIYTYRLVSPNPDETRILLLSDKYNVEVRLG